MALAPQWREDRCCSLLTATADASQGHHYFGLLWNTNLGLVKKKKKILIVLQIVNAFKEEKK